MVAKSESGVFVRTQKTDFSLFLNISETSRKQKNGGHNLFNDNQCRNSEI